MYNPGLPRRRACTKLVQLIAPGGEIMQEGWPAIEAAEMDVANHYRHSSLRERIIEHIFVGDALREWWRDGVIDVEVLRSEFDAHGYDLVMSRGRIVRHIQLKASTRSKPSRVAYLPLAA
jgi:hypothetical protein